VSSAGFLFEVLLFFRYRTTFIRKEDEMGDGCCVIGSLGVSLVSLFIFYQQLGYEYDVMRDDILRILLAAKDEKLDKNAIIERLGEKIQFEWHFHVCLFRMEEESLVGRFQMVEPLRKERGNIPRWVYILTTKGRLLAENLPER
jgi:hypothetical protein